MKLTIGSGGRGGPGAPGSLNKGHGTQYGLIKRGGVTTAKAPSAAEKRLKGIFGQDALEDDSDEEQPQSTGQSQDVKRVNRFLASRPSTALLETKPEDASIYDYDGAYDSFKAVQDTKLTSNPLAGGDGDKLKARYIHSLQAASKLKERESDRAYERKLQKENAEDGEDHSDKPQFITAAYKERLKERQLWESETRRQELLDKQHDVSASGMEGFYANLLTKNIAYGGDVDSSAMSAFTVGSARQERLLGGDTAVIPSLTGHREEGSTPRGSMATEERPQAEERTVESCSSSSSGLPVPSGAAVAVSVSVTQLEDSGGRETGQIGQKSKAEALLSARERFLQRKKFKSETAAGEGGSS